MNKINLYISSLFILILISLVSCKKEAQHPIEKTLAEMRKAKSTDEIRAVKSYTIDSLNFVQLDSLGLTKEYINIWIQLYINEGNANGLVKDSKKLIDRLAKETPTNIELFIKAIANSSTLSSSPNIAAPIVAYPYGIDVQADEYSEIANRLYTSTRLPGNKAPFIDGLTPSEGINATLVLFYDESCGICQHILEDLIINYDQLTAQGVRIVTISANSNKDDFEDNMKKYPWADKLCDYQSFNGDNFKRFGIAATPIIFVMDKDWIVTGQFNNLKETGLMNSTHSEEDKE